MKTRLTGLQFIKELIMGWEYLIVLAISTLISIALAPKPVSPSAAVLEDFSFPQVDEGTPQIVVFGDAWIDGWMVLSYGNLRTEDVKADGAKK